MVIWSLLWTMSMKPLIKGAMSIKPLIKQKDRYKIILVIRKIEIGVPRRSSVNTKSYNCTSLYMQLVTTSTQTKNIFNYPSTLLCEYSILLIFNHSYLSFNILIISMMMEKWNKSCVKSLRRCAIMIDLIDSPLMNR